MLLTYEKMEEEWFCFIQEANFHIIDKITDLIIK